MEISQTEVNYLDSELKARSAKPQMSKQFHTKENMNKKTDSHLVCVCVYECVCFSLQN